jgi:protein-disulfide isomerase
VSFASRLANALLAAVLLTTLGCHAQTPATPAAGTPLSPALTRRVEVLVRQKANLPPGSTLSISGRTPSEFPGFDTISVTVHTDDNTSRPIRFLLSSDGKTLAQITKFDISADPRNLLSQAGRPSRGGPSTAPVLIVGFDDLECPYCARLHATIFPAITNRYGNKVRIVYKDYPLVSIHPWAMHAAVDVNCLADQSPEGYWTLVDQIHAHADDISAAAQKETNETKALAQIYDTLDRMTTTVGKNNHVDDAKLQACLKAQDTKPVKAEMALGDSFNLDSTPTLFINGDKIDGALPIDFIFHIIDQALLAEGVTPPPPYVAPAPPTPPAPATKPAN